MTGLNTTTPPPPAPAAPPPAAPGAPAASMLSKLSQGELLVGAGALLVLLGELLFGLLVDEYFIGQFSWAVAAVALLAVALRAMGRTLPGYDTILVLAGFVMAVVGVRDLVFDLRALGNYEAVDFLGMLAYYVGVVAMAAGALMVWRKRPA